MKCTLVIALAFVAQLSLAFVVPSGSAGLLSCSRNSNDNLSVGRRAVSGSVRTSTVKMAAKEDGPEVISRTKVVAEVIERTGSTKAVADLIISAFQDTVMDNVADGKKVSLKGFGTFEGRSRSARIGRNPQTGEPLEIKATKSPAFSASKGFKNQVKANYVD